MAEIKMALLEARTIRDNSASWERQRRRQGRHVHEYVAHPLLDTHACCALCGFALPLELVSTALAAGARLWVAP